MITPNFFIVGAPKCGTTALSEYLRYHPQVFMSTPKEPHYFATDFPEYRAVGSWQEYLTLFSKADSQRRARGEASVFYLYSQDAATNIRSRLPEAKFIVLLRNPVELTYSMHAQALCSRDETIVQFSHAWGLCNERKSGRQIPSLCRDVKILLYDELARLGAQLERLLTVVPVENVRWFLYDDFATDPRKVYMDSLKFLGLDDDGRQSFPRVNPQKRNRAQWLAQFTQKPPQSLVRAALETKRFLGIRRWRVLDALRARNQRVDPTRCLEPALHGAMIRHFEPDIRLLMQITQRDLTAWLGVGPIGKTASPAAADNRREVAI